MKKRILALALAATTAFSMFGASLSVSAADKDAPEKFVAYTPVDAASTLDFANVANSEEDYKTLLDKIYTGAYDANLAIESGNLYLFDFTAKLEGGAYKDGKFDSKTAGYDAGADIKESLGKEIAKGYGLTSGFDTAGDNMALILAEFFKEYEAKATDKAINDDYKLNIETVKALSESDFSNLYYDADLDGVKDSEDSTVWEAYGLAALKAAYTASEVRLSSQIYLMSKYADIAAVLNFAAPKTTEEKYNALLDKALALSEADFTANGWKAFSKALSVAEAYAAAGDYTTALEKLQAAWDARQLVKPDVTDLRTLLDSLFVNGYTPGANVSYAGNNAQVHVYLLENNKVNGNPSFEWNRAFNRGTYKDSFGDSFTGCYFGKASDMYYDIFRRANSGKHTQAEVDEVIADLEAAVSALSEGGSGANWEILKLEELVAKAENVVESDYNTARTAWKSFAKALAAAQDVLAEAVPTSVKLENAYKALDTAMSNLKTAKLSPSAADKAELKSLLTEAKALLKELDGKVLAQVTALENAVKTGDSVYANYSSKLISEVAAAIADLKAAIDFNEVIMGWNKLENGTYKYGTADGYVTSDWKWIGNAWYYFDAEGIMVTGWQQLDGAWYYFYTWGGMAKGWAQVNGTWYYLNPNGGKMLSNGWNWIDGKCYYFYSWGGMAANTTIDGYKVDASGAWVK